MQRADMSPTGRSFHRRGFTLIELVMVMVIIGILAVVAMPRFADRSVFAARGFQDETLALLHYAQKAAIAQHRTVCVAFTASSATLTLGATTACGTPLSGPNGSTPFTVTARSGTGYSPTPNNFYFDALGRASAGQLIAVTGSGTVTVEAETGYVR